MKLERTSITLKLTTGLLTQTQGLNNLSKIFDYNFYDQVGGGQRFLSEPQLLISGHMFGLSCVRRTLGDQHSKIPTPGSCCHSTHTASIRSSVGCSPKSAITLSVPPDLQLWKLQVERGKMGKVGVSRENPAVCSSTASTATRDRGSWEKAEEREVIEVKQEPRPEQKEIKLEDVNKPVTDAKTDDNRNTVTHTDTHSGTAVKTEKHTHADCGEHTHTQTHTPEPRPASVAECQLNLLEHVESLHHQISARMDLIERELDVLESWLDHSGELEPPDPLSRLPQLKQRIRRLLRDLCIVRRLSVCR
ncbi:PHD finger protein 20-like isoform X1 [Lates japonicus]|uniref:PHD finger protein 20-like isoform X1 n=1 Tax=Lates japonicus TaxID=270547 RepID=A0AAD3M778_LATJO|nr:PHD finger protein 20-like isoform X1 [Lates japonicus]